MVGLEKEQQLASHQHLLFPSRRKFAAIWTLFSRSFSRGKQSKLLPPRLLLGKFPREKADGMDAVGDETQTHLIWTETTGKDGIVLAHETDEQVNAPRQWPLAHS